jgi:hypothetical protein
MVMSLLLSMGIRFVVGRTPWVSKTKDDGFAAVRGGGDVAEELAGEDSDDEDGLLGGAVVGHNGSGNLAKVLTTFLMLKKSLMRSSRSCDHRSRLIERAW